MKIIYRVVGVPSVIDKYMMVNCVQGETIKFTLDGLNYSAIVRVQTKTIVFEQFHTAH